MKQIPFLISLIYARIKAFARKSARLLRHGAATLERKRMPLRPIAGFLILFLAFGLPLLRTDEIEPLVGGQFVGDLTVENHLLEQGEPLSLDEATRLTLLRNLRMQSVRLDNRAEALGVDIAKSVYDTQWDVFATYERDNSQQPSVVIGDRVIRGVVGTSLTKKIPTGTNIKIEAASSRESTNSAFTTLSRYYESYGSVEVTQPILRNAFGYVDRKRIKLARINVKQFDLRTVDEIENLLYEARLQYWDLKFAYENLRARRKALRKAQDFFKITGDKLDIGLTEKPDLFAAEANVRMRVLDVLEAENNLQNESYKLRVMLNLPEVPLIQPDEELQFNPVELDYQESLQEALENRRDLQTQSLAVEEARIEKKIRFSEKMPDLEFEGRYSSTGLDRELASSQGEVGGFNHPVYYAGLRLSHSLENRERGSYHEQAELDFQKQEKQLQLMKLEVAKEVDSSYRDVLLAVERVKQTSAIESLQQKKLGEEEKNFNRGRSSSKTIIDFQEDVIESEIERIRALLDYNKALETFYRTSNRLLDKTGVKASNPS